MALHIACMRRLLSVSVPRLSPNPLPLRAFSAATQPTGRTGSGSVTNVSGQKDQEAAADAGAPPPDSSFDAGGAAGTSMGDEKKEEKSQHTQNFDKEAVKPPSTPGKRGYSTSLHANSFWGGCSFSSSANTPTIDKEKATSDKDIFRSAPGGAAMEDKEPDADPQEGSSPWGGEGDKVEHKGQPTGRQTGTGSVVNMSGSDFNSEESNVPPDSGFDAGGSGDMGKGNASHGREHSQNFDDEMKTKGGSGKAVNKGQA